MDAIVKRLLKYRQLNEMAMPSKEFKTLAVKWVIYELYRAELDIYYISTDNIEIKSPKTEEGPLVVLLKPHDNDRVEILIPSISKTSKFLSVSDAVDYLLNI